MKGLVVRQIAAIMRIELRRSLFSRRALFVLGLAGMPVLLLLMAIVVFPPPPSELETITGASSFFATFYQTFVMHVLLYVACVWSFVHLFRGEMLAGSLHYWFLSPVRRDVIVAGKYLAGVTSTAAVFGASTLICFGLVYSVFGTTGATRFLFEGPGLGHLGAYLLVTVLGCAGYGALFLLIGLFFKNPVVPAIVIFGIESINQFLPSGLKRISVIHYLESLCPIPVADGPFALISEPTPAWLALPGLAIVILIVLTIARARLITTEISYGTD